MPVRALQGGVYQAECNDTMWETFFCKEGRICGSRIAKSREVILNTLQLQDKKCFGQAEVKNALYDEKKCAMVGENLLRMLDEEDEPPILVWGSLNTFVC